MASSSSSNDGAVPPFEEWQRTVKVALVCASNNNRSMEAHFRLKKHGFNAHSYGTSSSVKLPGPAIDKPNVYSFGTPYRQMFEDLRAQNPELYKQNGVLRMLERNMKVKEAPEQWQKETRHRFNIVVTFEDRVYEAVMDDMFSRGNKTFEPMHLINLPTKDNAEEALVSGSLTLKLCKEILKSPDWEQTFERTLEEFQMQHNRPGLMHCVLFY
ncbi:RNA polymerase II subunit A C-terminal domain phosphatase [Balamuthia mandrillaris]